MPQKSTFSPGRMTSRRRLPRAAASSAALGRRAGALGRRDDVAARLLVRLEADEAFLLGIFQEVGERAEAVVRLVEAGHAALQRLLHHGAPDALALAALGDEGVQRLEQHVEGLLLLVLAGRRRL